jgi:kynurenine formamidase
MDIKVGKDAIYKAAKELSNWGRWGADDQIGTLNHVTPEAIVHAASLIRRGRVFSLCIPLDGKGPQQYPDTGGRWNPIHTMIATGTDALSGNQDAWNGCRYADDSVNMPLQSGTHWDALGHVFLDDKMYNGYPANLVDSRGAQKNSITQTKDKMVGRGVLLDVARYKGVEFLPEGYGISNDELDAVAKAQKVEIRQGDFVLVRTGELERRLKAGAWGTYSGGNCAGVKFENCYWSHAKKIAAISSDTWGVEVIPNDTNECTQPWHWVVIPALGLTMGENFFVKELAEDCAADGVYEYFFTAPPLVITGATGSPINPQAIK